ncbi:MAG: phosphoribosylanthranilate isomerase [Gemmatimonadota bacterium]
MNVKICCITSLHEANMALRAGASALGFVSEMPSGPGVISEEHIATIVGRLPAGTDAFLLTSRTEPDEIEAQVFRCRPSTVQLVDRLGPGVRADLRRRLPGVRVVQVVHVSGSSSVDEAIESAEHSDAILLDSGRPKQAVRELGGTGRAHDWEVSRRIVETVEIPVYLAGGLDAANVAEAIGTVRPFGVDVCSGVRTNGDLDGAKLGQFVSCAVAVKDGW